MSELTWQDLYDALKDADDAIGKLSTFGLYFSDERFHDVVHAAHNELGMWRYGMEALADRGEQDFDRDKVFAAAKGRFMDTFAAGGQVLLDTDAFNY